MDFKNCVWILRIGTFNLYWTGVFTERKEFVNCWFILLGKNEIVGCVAEVNSVLRTLRCGKAG